MQDFLRRVRRHRLEDDMDMVGHDDPSVEVIALAIEKAHGTSDDSSALGVFEHTCAASGVQPFLKAVGEAFGVFAELVVGKWLRVRRLPLFALGMPLFEFRLRNGIR